jgi:DNA gyrase subunit A
LASGEDQMNLGPDGGRDQNLIPINIEDEMRQSYLAYAMSVIIGRALPDIRDGLKPVHRRILYAMSEMGLAFNRPTRKCAGIVGEVLGKFHPHGDTAVYDALVRMAQSFSLRYPLVTGQGNFGSVDGDPPAAYRYTEARLSRIASTLLEDIDAETVDFKPNFDDRLTEPEVLPTRVPNLLINGSNGIAVGMATNIPPHNLTEIVNATIMLIEKPKTTLQEILQVVPGPDFPTGGYILGRHGIVDAFAKGRGSLKLRAKTSMEPIGKDREAIIIHEIPYQVNKARLVEQIAALVNEKKLEGISEIRDESDRDGMRVVIELKRGEQSEIILNNLYKNTQMQISFGVIMLSIVNGQPRELGIIDILNAFIEHRVDVVRRRTEYLLRKARDREHLLLGFQRALLNIDAVIELIKSSRTPKEAKEKLMEFITPAEAKEYAKLIGAGELGPRFSERQAQAIIELQLQRLTGMEQEKILAELGDIQKLIAEYNEILGSETVLKKLIVKELKEVQKEFGDERRTQIIEDTGELTLEDLVADEEMVLTVTRSGYLKRTPLDTYRRQTRGGKGRTGMATRSEDVVEHMLIATTHTYLMVFTNKGRVYWSKIYNVPDVGPAGKGKHVSNIVNLLPDEEARAFFTVKDFPEDKFVMMVTRQGVIKKTSLDQFSNVQSRGIIALTVDDDDELLAAELTTGSDEIVLATHEGMAIRFNEEDVRSMGRQARGVRGMDLDDDDYLISMVAFHKEEEALVLTISELGLGKRTLLANYRLQSRGGKGVTNMKTTAKTGKVIAALAVSEGQDVVLITKEGKLIRTEGKTIREAGRATQGVRLVRLDDGDQVAAATVIASAEEEIAEVDGQSDLPLA